MKPHCWTNTLEPLPPFLLATKTLKWIQNHQDGLGLGFSDLREGGGLEVNPKIKIRGLKYVGNPKTLWAWAATLLASWALIAHVVSSVLDEIFMRPSSRREPPCLTSWGPLFHQIRTFWPSETVIQFIQGNECYNFPPLKLDFVLKIIPYHHIDAKQHE